MPTALAVALAGALGTLCRYALDTVAGDRIEAQHQAYTTFGINVTGSFLLGLLIGYGPGGRWRVVAGVGFLGAFTTFSALMGQVHNALDRSAWAHGALLPLASVLAGVAAVYAGAAAGRQLA